MQDRETGEMKELSSQALKDIEKELAAHQHNLIQAQCDAVQPDRTKQGPVFQVGEVIELRGGRFQITKIEPGYLKLKSLPKA